MARNKTLIHLKSGSNIILLMKIRLDMIDFENFFSLQLIT